ncbi:GNAT family N-acetyltransferase [Nostoc sp. TCL240-02]|uniref:GNAT family N-acetyltransferase n=1 Tax=Nostoc sp. TCL240-02 TaxID=2572090 RepID=UPI00157FB900|nr:GNAT family N-acetyltransferase [Nostoc sp. TCL240-02]QKQ75217.1 GNAT family N-acetyltransferase [Nostoc sp. TCL240-02]
MQRKIELKRGVDNTSVEAYLVDLVQRHIDDYVNYWVESLRLFSQEDKYWDWIFKLRYISNQENLEGYAIECENKTQGLMIIETQMHGSRLNVGKRLVYVDGIATAPTNRMEIQRPPQFKGVGQALLNFARIRSVELGYEGRIGLHSLPRSEGFYEKQNMLNCGSEEEYDNLVYFEYGVLRRR